MTLEKKSQQSFKRKNKPKSNKSHKSIQPKMKEDPGNLDWEKTELNAYLDIARINDSIDHRNY